MKCRREATCGLHLHGMSGLILGVLTRPRGPSGKRGRKTCLPQDTITGATIPTEFWRASNPRTGGRRPKNRFTGVPFLAVAMF